MAINVGDRIPDATLMKLTDKGPQPVKTADYFKGRKVVVFALPGAFTPTCSNQHLPGFIQKSSWSATSTAPSKREPASNLPLSRLMVQVVVPAGRWSGKMLRAGLLASRVMARSHFTLSL